jgi:phosphoserine phosphatase RsbU/P
MNELDPLLLRQLRRAGLTLEVPPSLEAFYALLERVSDQYKHSTEDRATLTRSLDLSTAEMTVLRERVEAERDRLQLVVAAIGDAIGVIGQSTTEGTDVDSAAGLITQAKQLFAERVTVLFRDGAVSHEESSQLHVIESSFVKLADQVQTLLREMSTAASMKQELEVARTVQKMLLPSCDVIARPGITIAAHFEPARECGGDWWNVQELLDGTLLLMVGDVTGHGISSAILTGAAKAAADLGFLLTRGKLGPGMLLHLMNHAIHQAGRQQVMMTAVVGLVDPVQRTLTMGNAGHVFPWLLHEGAARPLIAHGAPLGASHTSEHPLQSFQLAPGDTLVLYTDGVTERENDAGEQFSEKRLRSACQRNAQAPATEFRNELVHSLLTFAGGQPANDDLTLMIARIE